MKVLDITGIFIDLVQKTVYADESKLKLLRITLIGIVDKIGAKNFVTLTAEVLKKNLFPLLQIIFFVKPISSLPLALNL